MGPGLAHWSGLSELKFRSQERAVSRLITGVSQLRTGVLLMSVALRSGHYLVTDRSG